MEISSNMSYPENMPAYWEAKYRSDQDGWDLAGVTPVFEALAKGLTPGAVCLPGCGRGYDAVMFAKRGFQVTAVDFAATAIEAVKEMARAEQVQLTALQEDLFVLPDHFTDTFEYWIEQTCFCAIHPQRREEYEQVVHKTVKPGGWLIGLWFPLDKPQSAGGPPWGVSLDQVKSIFKDRWQVVKEEFPRLSIPSRKGREKLIIFEKL
jgi:SAM-dependent methyltransferase